VRLPGEELPALAYAMRARKALQHPGRIALRVDRDRVHEQVTADALFEQILHPHEIGRDKRAGKLAARVHHVDRDELVLDEVVVEAHALALVCDQGNIGEMVVPDQRAGRAGDADAGLPAAHAEPRSSGQVAHGLLLTVSCWY